MQSAAAAEVLASSRHPLPDTSQLPLAPLPPIHTPFEVNPHRLFSLLWLKSPSVPTAPTTISVVEKNSMIAIWRSRVLVSVGKLGKGRQVGVA